jgi:acylphosphatase
VQGVGFRHFVVDRAGPLGITGWVRNQVDGSVEIEAEGQRTTLESFIDAVGTGPPAARVQHVDTTWHEEGPSRYRDFTLGR